MEYALAAQGFKARSRQLILHQLQRLADGTEQLECACRRLDPPPVTNE